MWIRNKETGAWSNIKDALDKDRYDSLKQDMQKFRLYSKCLSGAVFYPSTDLDDVYSVSKYKTKTSWFYGIGSSQYAEPQLPQFDKVLITPDNIDKYKSFTREYGLTLKNLFTPTKLIEDSHNNFYYVDIIAPNMTIELENMILNGASNKDLYIDGVKVINGHTILIKDMITSITLSELVDPNDYFDGNFYQTEDINVSSDDFYYYNSYNGIYRYDNGLLIRTDKLSSYESSYRLAVTAKLGDVNTGKQYHLSRLKDGLFPIDNQPIEFLSSNNWIFRNVFDYNNIYDLNLNSVIKLPEEVLLLNGRNYNIPVRTISVGEFGAVLNNESIGITQSRTHIIYNKYKENLNHVEHSKNYYWACGDMGRMIKINKLNFEISSINLNTDNKLTHISFLDDSNIVVVGSFGTIYISNDGGDTWSNLFYQELEDNNFRRVKFLKNTLIYIFGENGTFIQLNLIDGKWSPWSKMLIKYVGDYDEYKLVSDITDYTIAKGVSQSIIGASTSSDLLFFTTSMGEVIAKDLTNTTPYEFNYLDLGLNSNIQSIECKNVYSDSGEVVDVDLYIASNDIRVFRLSDIKDIRYGNVTGYTYSHSVYSSEYVTDLYHYGLTTSGTQSAIVYTNDSGISSCSNGSKIFFDGYSPQTNGTPIDPLYGIYDKSKLLFLDYDIASKLNFFTDNGKYILPNGLTFSYPYESIEVKNIPGEYNWLSYYKDVEKTFEYYTPMLDSNKVEFNSTFRNVNLKTLVNITFNDSSNDPTLFGSLFPASVKYDYGTFPINAVSNTFISKFIYFNKDVMIIRLPENDYGTFYKGDVIRISNTVIDTTLIINKVFNNIDTYLYVYTNFNENIIKNLVNLPFLNITFLNRYYNLASLVTNFNNHPISIGYKMDDVDGTDFTISARFNNKTAYYNMQSIVRTSDGFLFDDNDMLYSETYMNFGFSPLYNLQDFLYKINPNSFVPQKKFTAMPVYNDIPLNGVYSSTLDNIFIDFGIVKTNKIYFGENLKFEWDSLWLNTFVDITIKSEIISKDTERTLITNKYVDDNGIYVIEVNKPLNFSIGDLFTKIDIKSRNTLQEISDDLQMMNGIQRSSMTQHVGNLYFTNLDNELKNKFPTDSYAKIFLSDYEIKDKVSGIVYTDNNHKLAFNVIDFEYEDNIKIVGTFLSQFNTQDHLTIITDRNHNLKVGDYININDTTNDTYMYENWVGFTSVLDVPSDIEIVVSKLWGNPDGVVTDATLNYVYNDPFLNYQPVDIMDVGIDVAPKQAVELNSDNYTFDGKKIKLINVDFNKFRFRCTDGLSVSVIADKYAWLLDAEISNALVGQNSNGLVWYSGTWKCGRWFGDKWYSGKWIGGDWYSGVWDSRNITYDNIQVILDKNDNELSSKWYNGRWFGGNWLNGTWYNGRWYAGVWSKGSWFNGIWNDGVWNNGNFLGGIWVRGTWNNGKFNCDSKPSYWIGGDWNGGDFENGRWFGGQFSEKISKSRFGTRATNSVNAIWDNGIWFGGEFHSGINQDANGVSISSDNHKYSYFKTGVWNGGSFYGGTTFNVNFKSGDWIGGVSDDIEIIKSEDVTVLPISQLQSQSLVKLHLNGVFRFSNGNEVTIVGPTWSNIGSYNAPMTYKVFSCKEYDLDPNITVLTLIGLTRSMIVPTFTEWVNSNLNIDTKLRIVSKFKSSNWYSGTWYNGVFEDGTFYGGLWYNGVFSGNWGY